MTGEIYNFLAGDHKQLDKFLERALRTDEIDSPSYEAFRKGILRHIAMEEKVLIPEAQKRHGEKPLPMAETIRRDHGAISALLSPAPTLILFKAVREILKRHNPLEEGPGGLYEFCEKLVGNDAVALLKRLKEVPEVKLAPYRESPTGLEIVARVLKKAGYESLAAKLV